jgi:hypothetical protein
MPIEFLQPSAGWGLHYFQCCIEHKLVPTRPSPQGFFFRGCHQPRFALAAVCMLPVLLSLATVFCSMFMPPTGGGRYAHRVETGSTGPVASGPVAFMPTAGRPMVLVMTTSRHVHGQVLAVEHALMLHNAWLSVLAEGNEWESLDQGQALQPRRTPVVQSYEHPADGGQATCCLCLEPLSACPCARFACAHAVHERCYQEFLQKTTGTLTCPLCRVPL